MNGHIEPGSKPHVDVIIIGAGISGINAAYRLQTEVKGTDYAILEARDAMGGTWDLFKYPGIRSDSDLFTFGFPWHPWRKSSPIADGPAIAEYVRETAALFGIDKHIRYQHKVTNASWSTTDNLWTLSVENGGVATEVSARFVVFGTGYYDYNTPLPAQIPGLDNFKGRIIHPQFWPGDLDYKDKKIVVVGSGATAITLIPNLAEEASKVTMLQRSPGYIISLPNRGGKSWLSYLFPTRTWLSLQRIGWIMRSYLFFRFCRSFPNAGRWIIAKRAQREMPKGMQLDPNFVPRYNPWEQRVCFCPDGDFYKSLHSGKVDIATDTIAGVTAHGIRLTSGRELEADMIITATGLRMQIAGGASVDVDGKRVAPSDKFMWRGIMLQDVPNAAFIVGYTNASWTIGADLTGSFVCRLLNYLNAKGAVGIVPRLGEEEKKTLTPKPMMSLSSTYVTAARDRLPKTGDKGPWQCRTDFTLWDRWQSGRWRLDEGLELIGEGKKGR